MDYNPSDLEFLVRDQFHARTTIPEKIALVQVLRTAAAGVPAPDVRHELVALADDLAMIAAEAN